MKMMMLICLRFMRRFLREGEALSTRNFNELNGKKLKVNKILKCYLYNNSFQILADIKDAVLDDAFEN